MILTALGDILGAGSQPERDLVVAFFADEEAGGGVGAQLARRPPSRAVRRARPRRSARSAATRSRSAAERAYLLQTGEKSLLWVRLVAHGTAAHGSRLIARQRRHQARRGRRHARPHRVAAAPHRHHARAPRPRSPTCSASTPSRSRPTSSPWRPARRRDSSRRRCAPRRTRPCSRPATSTTSSPTAPRRSSTSARCPGEEDAVLAEVRELIGDDIEIEIVHRDVGLEAPTPAPLVDAVDALARDARSRSAACSRTCSRAAPTTSRSVAARHRGLRLRAAAGCRTASTSRRCSTASTSACRSTH